MKTLTVKVFSLLMLGLFGVAAQGASGDDSLTAEEMEQECYEAFNQSDAADSCSDPYQTPGNHGGITVHDDVTPYECTVLTACDYNLTTGACCWASGYKGTKDELSRLVNCGGPLEVDSC